MQKLKLLIILYFIIPNIGFGQCDSFDGTLSVSTSGHTTSAGYTQQFVCVDNTGAIIAINLTGNFTGLSDGNYTIYAVNYEGTSPASLGVGLPWSNVDTYDQNPLNCFESISNNYSVCSTSQVCNADPLIVSSSNFTTSAGYQQLYVLVDSATGNIIDANSTGTFNQSSYIGVGNFEIYAVNTNDVGLIALLSGNGTWNNALTSIGASCADFIGPKLFNVINCCDVNLSGIANNETCTGNDGSIDITLSGSGTYDILINGSIYAPLDDISANTYNIPNLSDGSYEIIVFDINTISCADTITASISNVGAAYNLAESLSACLNSTVTYPDGSTELITGNTSHISNLSTVTYGCDSIITTNITATSALTSTVNENVCFGEQFTSPQGNNYSAGSFDEIYTSASGCDSTLTFVITEDAEITNNVSETVCFGAQFTSPQGNNYSAGSFDEIYTSAAGCDSTVTFVVTEDAEIANTVNELVCFGAQFTSPQGNNYSAGSFNEIYTSATGCDSTVTFVITEAPEITNNFNETVCFGAQFTSPQGNNYSAGSFNEIYASASGCDSTVTFVITEVLEITNTVNETICFGTQFTSPQGNNYGAGSFDEIYTSASGCDSTVTFVVTEVLEITNTVNETICFGTQFTSPQGNNYGAGAFDETYNSVAGCDSIVTFNITELVQITNSVNESICVGSQFTSPQGNNYSAGSFDEIYNSSAGCDSTVTFIVAEVAVITNTINETVCFGNQFTSPQGNNYGAGSFDETYNSVAGCDSIVTFVVTELTQITSIANETVCAGSQFTSPQGNTYSAGSFDEIYNSAAGCDSIVTFVITESSQITNILNETVCTGTQFTSPQGNNYGVGSFDETYLSVSGCDSIVTFVITESAVINNNVSATICFGTQFTSPQGNNYGPGTYNEIYQSITGCDSVVTFNITEVATVLNTINESICFGTQFTSPQGNLYGAGSHNETYNTVSGCDSIVTFIVTELQSISSSQNETVCFGTNYTSNQGVVYPPGTYTEVLISASGCDSTIILTVLELEEVNAEFVYFGSDGLNSEIQFTNTSSGAHDFIWNFGDQSSVSNEESPLHGFPPFESDEYTITLIATNSSGCTDTAIQTILVQDELIFYVPNTFTPDGDQFNQSFKPVFSSGFDPFNFKLQIYNRWGELVFESPNPAIGWDGTYKGKYAQDGTYTWRVELKVVNNDEKLIHVGHVNMLR